MSGRSAAIRRSRLLGGAVAGAGLLLLAAGTPVRVAGAETAANAGSPHGTPAEIRLPGERVFPESITSGPDGTVYIGSVGARTIFRAKPHAEVADPWIAPGTGGMQAIFGVLADPQSQTLWACSGSPGGPPGSPPPMPSALQAFDLETGSPKGRYEFPTAGAMCNDIAVAPDGTAYATDTMNMEVVRLEPGAKALEVWAGGGAFGPKGGVLDGIAVVGEHVLVNALATGKLFSVPIGSDGKAGKVVEVALDRPLERPDGMRAFGKRSLLVVESGGQGRLTRIDLDGATGKATTLKEGFPDGPVSVTVVGETAFVLEGQLRALMRPDPNAPPKPFRAVAVKVGPP